VTDDIDDGRLAAFLDRQLDEAERRAIEAALTADPALRERLRMLARGDLPLAAAFDAALAEAPIERMRERLKAALAPPRPAPRARAAGAIAAALPLFSV
jgi:anti-sigma factor RsiW